MKGLGWLGLAVLSALGAAGVAVFASLGLKRVDATLATTLRAIIMALMLAVLCLATGRVRSLVEGDAALTSRAWAFIALSALCGAGSWLAYFAALRLGPAGAVAAVDRLSVAIVFVLGMLVLGEQHTWRGWAGLGLLVIGVFLVAVDKPNPA